jgi:hypothetical protein
VEKIRVLRELCEAEKQGRRDDAAAADLMRGSLRAKVVSLEAEIEKHRVAECSLAEQYYDVQLKCHDLEQQLESALTRGASSHQTKGGGRRKQGGRSSATRTPPRSPAGGRAAPYSYARSTPGHTAEESSAATPPPTKTTERRSLSGGRSRSPSAAKRSAAAVAELESRIATLEVEIARLRSECAELKEAKTTSMNVRAAPRARRRLIARSARPLRAATVGSHAPLLAPHCPSAPHSTARQLVALLQKDKETFRAQAGSERREHDAARKALEVLRRECDSTRRELRDKEMRATEASDQNRALAATLMEYRRKLEVLQFGRERRFAVRVHRGRLASSARGELRLFMDSSRERAIIDIFCDGSHARRDMRQIVDVHATPGSATRFEICFSEGVDARLGERGIPGARLQHSLSATWGRSSAEALRESLPERSSSTSIRAVLPSTKRELLDSDKRDVVLSTIRGFLRLVQQQQDGVASIDGDGRGARGGQSGALDARSGAEERSEISRAALDSEQTVALDLAEFLFG